MSKNKDGGIDGFFLSLCITGVFVILKLAGAIDWSWWWVLSPPLIVIALVVSCLLVVIGLPVMATLIGLLFDKIVTWIAYIRYRKRHKEELEYIDPPKITYFSLISETAADGYVKRWKKGDLVEHREQPLEDNIRRAFLDGAKWANKIPKAMSIWM